MTTLRSLFLLFSIVLLRLSQLFQESEAPERQMVGLQGACRSSRRGLANVSNDSGGGGVEGRQRGQAE